jgi:hypothetical protein
MSFGTPSEGASRDSPELAVRQWLAVSKWVGPRRVSG